MEPLGIARTWKYGEISALQDSWARTLTSFQSPKSESAHQPWVLQVHPPWALHGLGKKMLSKPVGTLTKHDGIAQTVGDAREVTVFGTAVRIEPGRPSHVREHPRFCGSRSGCVRVKHERADDAAIAGESGADRRSIEAGSHFLEPQSFIAESLGHHMRAVPIGGTVLFRSW